MGVFVPIFRLNTKQPDTDNQSVMEEHAFSFLSMFSI